MLASTYPVGIDVGAQELFVATPRARQTLDLKDAWHIQLPQLIAAPGKTPIVALEPTGRHYSAPVIAVLARANALIMQVDHATTASYRKAFVGPHKTDAHDADALMQIAAEWPRPVRGTRILNPDAEALTSALRAIIQAYARATKDQTRATNRLRQLAHHIWPALAQHLDTYLRAVTAGAVSPQQLRTLAAGLKSAKKGQHPAPYLTGQARAPLYKLAAAIPDDVLAPPMFDLVIPMLNNELQDAARKLDGLDELLRIFIGESRLQATTQALRTVPRSSTIAIAALHAAAHCELNRYTPSELRGAVGFHPQRHQSGSQDASSQSLRGYRPARGALHVWTLSLLDPAAPPNPIRDYWQAKKAEGHRYAFQAARGKLVRVLAGIAQTGQPCNWEQP